MAYRLLAASDVDGQRGFAVLHFFLVCTLQGDGSLLERREQAPGACPQSTVLRSHAVLSLGVRLLSLCVHECLCRATLLNFFMLLHSRIFKGFLQSVAAALVFCAAKHFPPSVEP